MAEPFFWDQRGAWYLNITKPDGKRGRIRLAKTKKKAFEVWKSIDDPANATNPLVATVSDAWIGHLKHQATIGAISDGHLTNARSAIVQFLNEHPRIRWQDFTKQKVTEFAAGKPWKAGTVSKRFALFRQLSAYAHDAMGLDDTMKGIRKPQSAPREKWVTPEEFRAIVDEIMGQPKHRHGFALYLASLYYSGARPGELAAARIGDYDGQTITLSTWKNYSKTGKKRRIYLETRGKVAIAKAIGDRTDKTDLIFKDSRGGQIHRDSVRNRLNRIVRKLGMDENIVAYSFRHAYAVRGLRSGIAISTLAELMGTSVDQIERVYGHRAEHTDMLASEALRIR